MVFQHFVLESPVLRELVSWAPLLYFGTVTVLMCKSGRFYLLSLNFLLLLRYLLCFALIIEIGKRPALACEACKAAVDPALASSDIVANVLCVCVGTHLVVGEFSRQFPASFFVFRRVLLPPHVCVCACEGSRCVCSLCCGQVAAMPYTRSAAMSTVI